jgi:hypothetical protein
VEGRARNTRIAQGFAGENGVQWDPVTDLFKVIVGRAIVGFNLVGVNSSFPWGAIFDLQCGEKLHEQICFDPPSALRRDCSFNEYEILIK